jgi:hypothetical protein
MDVKISEKNYFSLFFILIVMIRDIISPLPFFGVGAAISRSIIRVVTGSFAPLTNPHTSSPKK